jgi:hypothetical protein
MQKFEDVDIQNLKIRIPTPKIEDTQIIEKSKIKKLSIFDYIIYCTCCYTNDDDY